MVPLRCLLAAAAAVAIAAGVTACGSGQQQRQEPAPSPRATGFHSGDCNKVSDEEVNNAAGAAKFTKVAVSDVGCFWQEGTTIGSFGEGMGISTWWYRGSDLDAERALEESAGRTLTELTIAGNKGFQAFDANACSVYIARDDDVIAWSIQTLNPASLPDLCTITDQLARLTQDRVN